MNLIDFQSASTDFFWPRAQSNSFYTNVVKKFFDLSGRTEGRTDGRAGGRACLGQSWSVSVCLGLSWFVSVVSVYLSLS